ncbi:MAG: hypothetical protein H9W81_13685 [Enterococcus sp.]|nr:hypothetical protein [Enterococcus sp.]
MDFKTYCETVALPADTRSALLGTTDSNELEALINTLPMSASVRNDLNIVWASTYDENYV